MIKSIYLSGKLYDLSSLSQIGIGGESRIYDLANGNVLKIFKTPDDPDFDGLKNEQVSAEQRINTHQTKLKEFPKNLSSRVVAPYELATNKNGSLIHGYSMKFLAGSEVLYEYGQRSFHDRGMSNNTILSIFKDMHHTVDSLHNKGVVIGDFNDLNVLVINDQAFFIDADSYQFDKYKCGVFTAKFVDPLLCQKNVKFLNLKDMHNTQSDWYAYAIMLFQSLLCVDPYGGIYIQKTPNKILYDERPLHRITVFNPDVRYPKPAFHYSLLSDDLLQYFHEVFEKDLRVDFPENKLDFVWQRCYVCGLEHGRSVCPACLSSGLVKQKITIIGNVTANTDFVNGPILFSRFNGSIMSYLYHENGAYFREFGKIADADPLNPEIRYRIRENKTYIAHKNTIAVFDGQKFDKTIQCDTIGKLPIYDTNSSNVYWVNNGELLKENAYGLHDKIGNVLKNQTQFWVGEDFGFGYYRSGILTVGFVFNTRANGINDSIVLDKINGQIVDSTCVFGKDTCWFFLSFNNGGKIINRCTIINSTGKIIAKHETELGDGSWLGTIRGKCAVSNHLFSATDSGIKRLDISGNEDTEFPSTEQFVSANSNLFVGNGGIYVVNTREVVHLIIK